MKARNNGNNLPTLLLLFVFLASLSVALAVRGADICDEVSFTPAQYFATGGSPQNVVVADFDGNGTQDFAVNNSFDVAVHFGDGHGGFSAPEKVTMRSFHQWLATGDFNGDGKPDLAVTNFFDETVSILLNDGTGGFGAPSVFPTGGTAGHVATGDFNNDNKLDLAILTDESGVTILLGNGSGQFGPPQSYAVPLGPVALTVADFNGDGNLDVAVSTYPSMTVKVLLGDGQGHLTGGAGYSLDGDSFAIISGDFNGDGNIDLSVGVINIYPNNHVAIFLGDGSGAFTLAQKIYVFDVTNLATGDFNGDGKLDLAAATYSLSAVSVALGDGSGHFGTPQDVLLERPRVAVLDVAAGDFNSDGKPDLVTADYATLEEFPKGNAGVLLNLPSLKCVAADPTAPE
jgi:hypothetical protein